MQRYLVEWIFLSDLYLKLLCISDISIKSTDSLKAFNKLGSGTSNINIVSSRAACSRITSISSAFEYCILYQSKYFKNKTWTSAYFVVFLEMKDYNFILGQATYCVLYIIMYTFTRAGFEKLWFRFCFCSRNHRRILMDCWLDEGKVNTNLNSSKELTRKRHQYRVAHCC